MVKAFKRIYFGIVLLFVSITTNAQLDTSMNNFLDSISLDDILGKEVTKRSYFKFSASYLSNSVYGGRKDTVEIPYLTPTLEYNHKSGLYTSAAFSILTNKQSRLDVTTLELGYAVDTIIHKLSGAFYVSRSFYNSSSGNVRNDVSWNVGANLQYDAKFVDITAMPFLMLGSNTDFGFSFSIGHSFYFENKKQTSAITITPNVNSVFGNTGFYQSARNKRQGPLQNFAITVSAPKKFQLLSYDFSIPVNFDTEKWGVYVNPTYAIAQNPVNYTIRYYGPNQQEIFPPNRPKSSTEDISNTFFIELGAYFKF